MTEFLGPGSVSVVMPAFNEEGNIETAIMECIQALGSTERAFEIIIVDDGSTDDTNAIATKLSVENPTVRIITNQRNLGLGGTLRNGFDNARGEFLFYTDSDLPIYMDDLVRALPLMKDVDFVTGFRLNRDEGPLRYLYSTVYNHLVRFLFRITVPDVNFSFKLFRRSLYESIELRSAGSFIDVELLAEAGKTGCRIQSIGVRYRSRVWGRSTLASPRVIWGILVELFQYAWGKDRP